MATVRFQTGSNEVASSLAYSLPMPHTTTVPALCMLGTRISACSFGEGEKMTWKKVYPTLWAVACAASLLLATRVSAAPLTLLGPPLDRPDVFSSSWYIGNDVSTYHGTNWDVELTITKTNVLLTGQYLGSLGGRTLRSVSWSFPPRLDTISVGTTSPHWDVIKPLLRQAAWSTGSILHTTSSPE
jgi:hypothetical protein